MTAIRRSLLLAGLGCLLAGPAALAVENEQALGRGPLRDAPTDIVALAGREAACQRWSSVEITNEASDARVEHALAHLKCDSLPAEAVALRRKYALSESALKALDTAEDLGP